MKWIIGIAALFSLHTFALRTAYFTVDLDKDWKCEINAGVWICQNSDPAKGYFVSVAAITAAWDDFNFFKQAMARVEPKAKLIEADNRLSAKISDFPRVGWTSEIQMGTLESKKAAGLSVIYGFIYPNSLKTTDFVQRGLSSVVPNDSTFAVHPATGKAPEDSKDIVEFFTYRALRLIMKNKK